MDKDLLTGRFLLGRARDQLDDEERQALEDAIGEVRELRPRFRLVKAGVRIETSALLIDGLMCSGAGVSVGEPNHRLRGAGAGLPVDRSATRPDACPPARERPWWPRVRPAGLGALAIPPR